MANRPEDNPLDDMEADREEYEAREREQDEPAPKPTVASPPTPPDPFMTAREHRNLSLEHSPAYAALEYYRRWLRAHRMICHAEGKPETRSAIELLPVFGNWAARRARKGPYAPQEDRGDVLPLVPTSPIDTPGYEDVA